jgi:hypothetical protein
MKIIAPAIIAALALLAPPVAAQTQGPAPRQDTQPPVKGDTLRGTGKASSQHAPSTPADKPGAGGADDATANMARTNSAAARSGAVNGRDALSPGEMPTGPSGAPAVGTTH